MIHTSTHRKSRYGTSAKQERTLGLLHLFRGANFVTVGSFRDFGGPASDSRMKILKICYASRRPSLREEVQRFLVAVNGLMGWAYSDLIDEVVKQLVSVWKAV